MTVILEVVVLLILSVVIGLSIYWLCLRRYLDDTTRHELRDFGGYTDEDLDNIETEASQIRQGSESILDRVGRLKSLDESRRGPRDVDEE